MKLAAAKPGMRVIFVPDDVGGDLENPDCRPGTIVSAGERYVYVKFDCCVKRVGIDKATPMGNLPEWLVEE